MTLAGLHPQLRAHAQATIDYARRLGLRPEVTSVYRTVDFQRRLYENHLACKRAGVAGRHVQLNPGMSCAWPANPPGFSAHNHHLAWDSTVPPEHQDAWNAIRRGFGWRVPASDVIHAEYPGWQQIVGLAG